MSNELISSDYIPALTYRNEIVFVVINSVKYFKARGTPLPFQQYAILDGMAFEFKHTYLAQETL